MCRVHYCNFQLCNYTLVRHVRTCKHRPCKELKYTTWHRYGLCDACHSKKQEENQKKHGVAVRDTPQFQPFDPQHWVCDECQLCRETDTALDEWWVRVDSDGKVGNQGEEGARRREG